jgi:hypothetical protein
LTISEEAPKTSACTTSGFLFGGLYRALDCDTADWRFAQPIQQLQRCQAPVPLDHRVPGPVLDNEQWLARKVTLIADAFDKLLQALISDESLDKNVIRGGCNLWRKAGILLVEIQLANLHHDRCRLRRLVLCRCFSHCFSTL